MNIYHVHGSVREPDGSVRTIDLYALAPDGVAAARLVIRAEGVTQHNVIGALHSRRVRSDVPPAEPHILMAEELGTWKLLLS